MQQTKQSMQQQLSTTAEALVKKIALASMTMEENVQQEQMQEIAQLWSEFAALKSEIIKGLSNVQTADVIGQAELRG